MRLSETATHDGMNRAVIGNRERYNQLQLMISSGKKFISRSEAPIDASAAARVRRTQEENAQWESNVNPALNWTRVTEGRLDEVSDVIQRIQELAVASSDLVNKPEDRTRYAIEVNQLLEQVVQAGNTRFGESYLFGGINTNSAPLQVTRDADGDITTITATPATQYKRRSVQVSETSVMEYGVSAAGEDGLFFNSTSGTDIFQSIITLRDELTAGSIPADSTVADLQSSLESVVNRMVENGVSQGRLEKMEDLFQHTELAARQHLEDLQDVDMAMAMTEYSKVQAALQASLQMASRINSMSIVNYV